MNTSFREGPPLYRSVERYGWELYVGLAGFFLAGVITGLIIAFWPGRQSLPPPFFQDARQLQ